MKSTDEETYCKTLIWLNFCVTNRQTDRQTDRHRNRQWPAVWFCLVDSRNVSSCSAATATSRQTTCHWSCQHSPVQSPVTFIAETKQILTTDRYTILPYDQQAYCIVWLDLLVEIIEGLRERTEYIDIFLFFADHSIMFCFWCPVYWWKGSVRF